MVFEALLLFGVFFIAVAGLVLGLEPASRIVDL
jgi:hypothetical protein